jgi:hypothetical protein
MSKRRKAYRNLETIIELSGSSPRALTQDGYGKWMMLGARGHVYADRKGFVIYVLTDNGRQWSRAKRDLGFCAVPQDHEDEGCLRLDRMPTKPEAILIRTTIGARHKGPQGGNLGPEAPFEVYLPDRVRNPNSVVSTPENTADSSGKRTSFAKSPRRRGLFWDSLGRLEVAQMGMSGPAYVLDHEIELDHPDWQTVVSPDGIETKTRRVKLGKPAKADPFCLQCGAAVNPKVTRFCSDACRDDYDDADMPSRRAPSPPIPESGGGSPSETRSAPDPNGSVAPQNLLDQIPADLSIPQFLRRPALMPADPPGQDLSCPKPKTLSAAARLATRQKSMRPLEQPLRRSRAHAVEMAFLPLPVGGHSVMEACL